MNSFLRLWIDVLIKLYLLKIKSNKKNIKLPRFHWQFFCESTIAQFLVKHSSNIFFLNAEYFLYLALTKRFFKKSVFITHSFLINKISESYIKNILSMKKLNIVITVHSGFSFLTKLLSDRGRGVIVVNNDPQISRTFLYSGVEKEITTLNSDQYTLAIIKELLNESVTIICCIDERSENKKYTTLRTNLIRFSQRFNTPLFIYKDSIDADGSIHMFFEKVSLKQSLSHILKNFVAFINSTAKTKRDFLFI